MPALLLVVGNCQAESLRLLLDANDLRTVRLPAVHELTTADIGALGDLLARTDLLVVQPIADDYRGLPLGSRQLIERLPTGARHAVVPTVRYAGLHPHHLLVHPPGLDDPDPPVVPYHDVRTLVSAMWARSGRQEVTQPTLSPDTVTAVAATSVAELARREQQAGGVRVSDLLAHPTAAAMRTINHPGNAVLAPLAARIRDALGLPARVPGVTRPLLDGVHAPLDAAVVAAHGLTDRPTPAWRVGEKRITTADVRRAHLRWYAERPAMLDAALARSGPLRAQLGRDVDDAARSLVALGERHSMTVTFHDVPQPGDGTAFVRRVRAYRAVADAATGWAS